MSAATTTALADWHTVFVSAAPIVSTGIGLVGLFVTWLRWREATLRRGDVLAWANEVIRELDSLWLVCIMREAELPLDAAQNRLREIIFNSSILVERGRLFFKNQVLNGHGDEKPPAYQGYRPRILDPIVLAHKVAREWQFANADTRLRLTLVAEDCVKQFVSLVQKEVGRGRTASAETAHEGDGSNLRNRLDSISKQRVAQLKERITEHASAVSHLQGTGAAKVELGRQAV
jgi:hypothetical protein